jgi:hypothetical protein
VTVRRRRKGAALAVVHAGGLGLVLGEADPGDLGVGVGERGDHRGVEVAVAIGGDLALVHGLVGEHRGCPRTSPMAKEVRHVRALFLSTGMNPHSSAGTPAFSTDPASAGAPADDDEDLVEHALAGALAPSKMTISPSGPAVTAVTLVLR